ncbi:zinc finger protein 567 [Ixodes scapularis]|nr:zinc finger protein 567 [Ixodes scapularis]
MHGILGATCQMLSRIHARWGRGDLDGMVFTTMGESFRCGDCGSLFSSKDYLERHWKMTHNRKEGRHLCSYCGYSSDIRAHVISHERTHTGERPFKCATCGKEFAQKNRLITHQRIHTGERPYKCDVCGQGFKQVVHMTIHKRLHTGDCPYVCEECGRAFNQKGTLVRHAQTHLRRLRR